MEGVADAMQSPQDDLSKTHTFSRLFGLPRNVCECGHNKDYHLQGKNNRCVFGVCDCQNFVKRQPQ